MKNKFVAVSLIVFACLMVSGCSNQRMLIDSEISKLNLGDSEFSLERDITFPLWKLNRVNYKLLFGGDVMIGRYVETLIKRNGEDYVFKNLKDTFSRYDDVIINLEGPFTPLSKHRQTIDGGFIFSFPENFVNILTANNINVVNLANNHTYNQGEVGFEDTIRIVEENQIRYFGHPKKFDGEVLSINASGVDIILIGINLIETINPTLEEISRLVSQTRTDNLNAIIIMNFHFGPEYKAFSSQNQKDFARRSIDAGADMVIGHHPHVVQELEFYNQKPIFYSLGNLIFDQYFSAETQEGFLVGMDIKYKDLQNIDFKNDPFVLLGGKHEVESITMNLIPYKSKMSQPYLLNEEEKQAWMSEFARKYNLEDFTGSFELAI